MSRTWTQSQMFVQLIEASPFHFIFEHGCAPVKETPQTKPIRFTLETDRGEVESEGYLLDWEALTCTQQSQLADLLAAMRGGTWRDVVEHMSHGGEIPIRMSQVSQLYVRLMPVPQPQPKHQADPFYEGGFVDWGVMAEELLNLKRRRP